MRILWHSNGLHCSTGYGTQTRYAIQHLSPLGHQFANFAFYGLKGSELQAGDVVMFPQVSDAWGRDFAGYYAERWQADVVLSLMDIWVLDDQIGGNGFAESLPCPWIAWFPVDGVPASPLTVRMAKKADYPVVYSRFGLEQMYEAGVECDYIPHGIDCDVFCLGDRMEARRKFGIPEDAFVVSMVAANNDFPSRKAFPENLEAFKRFQARHPEALIYLHTDLKPAAQPGSGPIGVNLRTLIAALDLPDCVMNVDQVAYLSGQITDQYVVDVYRASDVLLAASCGEGFGLPIAEAQACGCPVITTDFSAMSELTVNGIATESLPQGRYLPGAFWQCLPDIEAIDEALEAVYSWPSDKRQWKSEAGIECIRAEYHWPAVAERYWRPFLEKVERGLWNRPSSSVFIPDQCQAKEHDWAPTGLYVDGILRTPCRRRRCTAELQVHRGGNQRIASNGFPSRINGIDLDIEDDPQSTVAKIVMRELETSYDLDGVPLEAGDMVIDIGAHVGIVSIYLAKRHPDIQVFAFEPIPQNFERLQRNLEANGITNVVAINKAVTSDGRDLELPAEFAGNSGGLSAFTSVNGQPMLTVQSVTLRDIFDKYDIRHCKLLKIDAEGAEHEILSTANGLLEHIDYLRGEVHINDRLSDLGYSIEGLQAKLREHMDADKVLMSPCRISD